MFNFRWLFIGGLAILLGVLGLICAIKRNKIGSQIMMFCSLSLGALTAFEEINIVWNWYVYGEFPAFNSTPQIIYKLKCFLCLLIATNFISLIVGAKKK